MKRLGWGILAFIFSTISAAPVAALDTIPTVPNSITGPFLITGYSFSGSNLRYIQIFNNSSSLASLEGWQVTSTTKSTPAVVTTLMTLSGQLEPGKHVFAATAGTVDRTAFTFTAASAASSPLVGAVSLIAPTLSGYSDEAVTVPTIGTSTVKEVVGSQANYYAKRDISATTGNYVSGFSFMLPTEKLKNDQLYVAPTAPLLQIVEIYPDAPSCSPLNVSLLCSDYVKLYNASTTTIDLSQFRLRTGAYGQSASSTNTRAMSGELASGQYVASTLPLSSSGSWIWIEDIYGSVRYDPTVVEYPSNSGNDHSAWAYDEQLGSWRWTITPTPTNTPNLLPALPVVNLCDGLRINEIAANVATEDQFIEITNSSSRTVDLDGCRLQTNRSATASYAFTAGELATGEYLAVYVKDTPLTLTKTTSGSVYVLSSDLSSEVDVLDYDNLAESTSYGLVDNQWRQTFHPTPGLSNIFLEYIACTSGSIRNPDSGLCNKIQTTSSGLVDCDEGKYRSVETNRCRLIETAAGLAPCDSDQYRSSETNRCRSLVSTASVLTPCAANQERSAETNRCRSIASSSTDLKPCAENQERNLETNRCRNKSSSIAADFPVEAVAQSSEATLGWWAFGGVGTLAAGYAGWEWRREVMRWIKGILPFGVSRP